MSNPSVIPAWAEEKSILLFDGVCNLCNGSVQFVIKRDPKGKFLYAPLQSEVGQALLEKYGLPIETMNSVVLVENGNVFTKSDAPLQVSRSLGGFWPLASMFTLVPKFIRDRIYDWIARNRYRWFGKREACMIPTPDLKQRFLG
jgi:predicted DCC family thiol-disulfide oxidoreductase YuxK